jgi:hypothetical protein
MIDYLYPSGSHSPKTPEEKSHLEMRMSKGGKHSNQKSTLPQPLNPGGDGRRDGVCTKKTLFMGEEQYTMYVHLGFC